MLHCQVKKFLKNATPREREMLQRYVDRCGPIHFAVNLCSLAASLAMICGPVVLPQSLPTDAKYPFSVENHPAWDLAYVHQVLAGLQCAEIGAVDGQAALLIWFAGARFELLANEFQNVTSPEELNICIKKHQMLLKNAEEMVLAVRFIIVTTSIMTTISIIFGGIHIVSCSAVGDGVYNSHWMQDAPELRKNITLVVQRSQKPITISVASVLPELSLRYYSSFLSKTFSFFTTLRIILGDVEDRT